MFWCYEIVIDIADYLYVGHPFGKRWHLLWFSYTLLQTGVVNLKVQTETSTSRVFFISYTPLSICELEKLYIISEPELASLGQKKLISYQLQAQNKSFTLDLQRAAQLLLWWVLTKALGKCRPPWPRKLIIPVLPGFSLVVQITTRSCTEWWPNFRIGSQHGDLDGCQNLLISVLNHEIRALCLKKKSLWCWQKILHEK